MRNLKGSDSVDSTWSSLDETKLSSTLNRDTGGLLDPAVGQCKSPLQEDGDSVDSIGLSPGGSQLVSALHDETTSIFDPAIGECESNHREPCESFPEEHGPGSSALLTVLHGRKMEAGLHQCQLTAQLGSGHWPTANANQLSILKNRHVCILIQPCLLAHSNRSI